MSTETAKPISGDTAKRRSQAVAGAIAGLAVIAILVVVFITVRGGSGDPATPPAAAPASAAAPAETPAEVPPSAAADPAQPPQPGAVETPPALAKEPVVKGGTGTLKDLKVTVLVPGTGPAVQAGQTVTANYVLVNYKTGQPIESSFKTGRPFTAPIGAGQVIQGWDKGIPGQKVGSRIQIDVPAALAYGPEQGDLRFVVDILAAQ
ncbi:FKBP-type peptidyl-prolyl cis-trans isomerase [Actinoplanes solisilvae]|uniref:FKBP-type peptidyl-prolyl cis-trans isomerase n=1 Tax=Actinoplanes solisilvae TaxID=2486853 RepID=UPI000FD9F12B|nr:FKBP-type peptidyl-prolyl cis-trans isomerase [Actinoplanes solisilvae]